ncbi:MAG: HEAT repeat domain-containing protein [Candidatus Marinimicrobia bacterium]|nr:HEAT repeat domain-containing protein [Candidatus Neomarinimicrobiota bacterium]MCF7850368.1 HEAT repeat domain-containing protein [Candidatus Neomarinimicrobiota bacterium]MCF7904493.1 HEAT repeat domain-containing protein [Candidatus Neomarinimicrobiota bacterium]
MDLETILGQLQLIFDQLLVLWGKVENYYSTLSGQELGMQIIALAIVFTFIVSVILASTVVFLRFKNQLKSRRLIRLERSWEKQLIQIVMSGEDDIKPPVIKRGDRFFYIRYLYRFAERLTGAERVKVKDLATPFLKHLQKGLKSRYPEWRARNLNILGTFGFPEYIERIKLALQDPSPIVSMTAARTLAHRDYPEHCELILGVLEKFDEWSMSFLSSMLSEMGLEAAPALRTALTNPDESLRVRIAAAEALREIGDLGTGDLAIKLLNEEIDPELKAALLRLIGTLGVPRHRLTLISLLDAPEFIIRIHTLKALGHIGEPGDGEKILASFNDESDWVALHAARALLDLGREDLLEVMAHDHPKSQIVRQVMVGAGAA